MNLSTHPLPLAAIFSVGGTELSLAEKSLFSAAQPLGFILFGRNCETPNQVRKLTESIREIMGWDCPILIDQEGGGVARLKPPQWPEFKAARIYGDGLNSSVGSQGGSLVESLITSPRGEQVLRDDMAALAQMLRDQGIDVNCAPVCDVPVPESEEILGSRAYALNPEIVARCAYLTAESFIQHGVTPVIKHIPGHGRARADSHHSLPRVSSNRADLIAHDFVPFKALSKSDIAHKCWGMVAHIVYEAYDALLPATLSPTIIHDVIRGEIGFDGLLLSDDLDMKALENYGSIADRANLCLQAGCDAALYCWADLKVMELMAAQLPPLSAKGWERWQKSLLPKLKNNE